MEPKKYVSGKHQYTKWGKVTEVRTMSESQMEPAAPNAGAAQLQIDMDETVAQGVYANLAGITHSETEFILDFLFLQPNQPKARLRARVISSPAHTKRLLAALADNLRKYEERFGVIGGNPAHPQR